MNLKNKALFALALLMLAVLISACVDTPQQNILICDGVPYSKYGDILRETFPLQEIASYDAEFFANLHLGTAVEVFDTQAIPAVQSGIADYWYPQYLATIVIAVDRDRTEAQIRTWTELTALDEKIGTLGVDPYIGHVLASIAYAMDGETFSLHSAAALLEPIHSKGNLVFDDYTAPIIICFDYQARAMIADGVNLEIIIPSEGTLTFARGLLSNAPLDMPDNRAELTAAGFRTTASRDAAYSQAITLDDYTHLNAELKDVSKIIRRAIYHTRLYTSADNQEHQIFALVFIVVTIVWVGSISHRAMQKGVRRSAFICSLLLVCWTLVRILKFQLAEVDALSRYAWYGFYVFQLSLPIVILWMALAIDRSENDVKLPKLCIVMAGINFALLLLVFTNDFHKLAFEMDLLSANWNTDYSYGPVYFTIVGVIFLETLLAQIVMVMKSRSNPRRSSILFPIALYVLMGLFCVAYILRIPIAWDSDLTIITGVFVLLYMEVCVRIGLMPVNRKYRSFFTHSNHNMQIVDSVGTAVLSSTLAEPLEFVTWQNFFTDADTPQAVGEDGLLFAGRINGGMVVWHEDISSINHLQREIESSVERLRKTNALLENEEKVRGKLAAAKARSALFGAFESEIRRRYKKLSEMLHSIPAGDERGAYISRVALLVCYIKRRCNLFFLEQNSHNTNANELIVYMDELAEFARVTGIKCLCNCLLFGQVSLRQATLMYDLFYALLEWVQEHGRPSLFVQMLEEDGNIIMRIMVSGDATCFNPGEELAAEIASANGRFYRKSFDDADGLWLAFSKGGDGDV